MEVKSHPLEGKLFELETKAKELRAEANRVFMVARELDRQAFEAMAEAKAVAVILDEYDRQQKAKD